jgi:glycosyltransferase involved in cell wall biosynthesis
LNWFLKNCWENLVTIHPNLKLHIAGKSMPESISNLNTKGIVIHGEVLDAMEFIREQGIMIVPLFSGSGIRIKILEGMALEKAIIGTTKAMEGIPITKKEGCIADTADDFCEAIKKLHLNKDLQIEMGKNARIFVKKHFNNDEIINQLMEFYSTI